MKPPSPPVVWEIDIPLATNPRLLKTLALVSGLAALISSLFMSVILGAQGDWDDIAPLLETLPWSAWGCSSASC